MKKALKILAFILVCELAGVVGSFFTTPSIPGWYAGLAKPPFNPPNGDDSSVDLALLEDFQGSGVSAHPLYPVGQLRDGPEYFPLRSQPLSPVMKNRDVAQDQIGGRNWRREIGGRHT